MPLVKISIRKGKSDSEKKALLNGIHTALNNWGVRGGRPASEIDLGFNLKV